MKLIELKAKNFCCFSEFSLPLLNQGLVLIGANNKDSDAASNNGAGKSTIFKALTWVLYGESIDGEKGDKIILDGQKKASVTATFEDQDGKWLVTRERKKGSPSVTLTQPNGQEFPASKGDVQNKINDMIGLDYHAFKNTVLFGQNDVSRFANPKTRDSERKKMLHKILRTDVYEYCYEFALMKRKSIRGEIQIKEHKLVSPLAKLEEIDFEKLESLREDFEDQRETQIDDYLLSVESYKTEARQAFEQSEDREVYPDYDMKKADNKINKLKATIKKMASVEDKVESIQQQIQSEKDECAEYQAELSAAKAQLEQLNERIEELDTDECPVCTSKLTEGNAKKYIEELKKKATTAREAIYAYKEDIQESEYRLKLLVEDRRRVQSAVIKIKQLQEDLEELEDERHEVLQARLTEEKRKEHCKQMAAEHIKTARQFLKLAKATEDVDNPYDEQIEETKKKKKEYEEQAQQIRDELIDLQDQLAHVEFWVQGFSSKGLPSYTLDSIMPFLTERANKYLLTLADGDIKVHFSTLKEMKSKNEQKDEIAITWEIEGRTDYPPSGGQQKKIEIATDFALMDLVATKEGGCVDLLALDEILDGLDSEGSKRVMDLLEDLRSQRGSIFVISHVPEVSESFEKSIMITKENGISTLRIN